MTQSPNIAPQPKVEFWHHRSTEELLAQFGSTASGLSAPEAARRLVVDGPNELKEGKRISPLQIFLAQ
ncbi:MAG: cation-transporting P-type ATPase, partial [Limisphaerales bacterium]